MVEAGLLHIFQGIVTLFAVSAEAAAARVALMAVGVTLAYAGYRRILEPLVMIPMGVGMAVVNAGVLILPGDRVGSLFVDPMASAPEDVVGSLQVYFLQPLYTLTFTNGLIAALLFLGIGAMTDLDFLIARPALSLTMAVGAELGTVATLPLAVLLGFSLPESAAIAIVGGADGPMVLFTSLVLARHLFVVIAVVAYLYLSVIYLVYPYLIKLVIPSSLRGVLMSPFEIPQVSAREKFAFALVAGVVLSFLFPVAAPLFAMFFLGVIVKEANMERYRQFTDAILSGSTMFLGFVLGALLSAEVILDPRVSMVAALAMVALLLSGIGGLLTGLIAYKVTGGRVNPLLGIAGVSCVPTTAKIAQKSAREARPEAMILPHAMGPCVAGVITTAILSAFYVNIIQIL